MLYERPKTPSKIFVLITFLAMIAVNFLAQNLPINGVTPAQVSDAYPNLFAPAGLTFSIWGLIYLLLAAFTLYFLGLFRSSRNTLDDDVLYKTGLVFAISSLANIAWIFSWHYDIIPLSMLLMIVILLCLIIINLNLSREMLTKREKFFIRLPFRIYFGWITVATIANATVLLVSLGFKGFGINESTWAVIIIFVGMVIGVATILRLKCISYGLVLVWAYIGITIKHLSANGFAGKYPSVIVTTVFCIVVFIIAEVKLFLQLRNSESV